MAGPNDGGHWAAAWAILRQNARDAVSKAPRESPALLFLVILLGLIAVALYYLIYSGPLV